MTGYVGRDKEYGLVKAHCRCLGNDYQGERVTGAIKDLKENPDSKMKHIAAHYGLSRDTLHNRYYGKTLQEARAAHPEQRSLKEEQERSVEE